MTTVPNRLALDGGEPVKTTPYGTGPKHPPEEMQALSERVTGVERMPLALGPSVRELRRRFCELFAIDHAVLASSGTAAIHTGLLALGVEPGDEVITTPATDFGTLSGILQLDAIPVFADVNPDTIMIDAASIEPCITSRTRAIIPVHYHGCPTDMDGIMALARRHDLKVLEDAAQSWLAQWRGKFVGTIGDGGAFSMNESKHLSVGEGGLLLTPDAQTARTADLFVDKCYDRQNPGSGGSFFPAVNYRLSEIAAVLGLSQVGRITNATDRRHEIGETIVAALDDIPGIRMLRSPDGGRSTYWHGVLFVDEPEAGASAHTFGQALSAEGIKAESGAVKNLIRTRLFQTLNENPQAFPSYRPPGLDKGRFQPDACPATDALHERVVRFRINEFMTNEDVTQSIEAIHKVATWYCHTPQRTLTSER